MAQNLITLDEWRTMTPFEQGYALYMQEDLPGSELKGQPCPYPEGSTDREDFQRGSTRAVLAVMDEEA